MARRVKNSARKNGAFPNAYLVCEGDTDERLLAALTQKILRRNHSSISVAIVPAHGKQQIPGLVQALDDQAQGRSRLGIVIDSDGQVEATRSFLRRKLGLEDYFLVIAHPSVESWFGEKIKRLAIDPEQTSRIVHLLDLNEIVRRHPEVAILEENLTRGNASGSVSQPRNASDPVHSHR